MLVRAAAAAVLLALLFPLAAARGEDAPITITGNAELYRWSRGGTGSAADPIVIGPLDIVASEGPGLVLQGTSFFVRLVGITVTGGGAHDGIRILGSSNVTVERASLEFDDACLRIGPYLGRDSRDVLVHNSTMRACRTGVRLEGATAVRLADNAISVSDQAVNLTDARGNRFERNNLSIAAGQTGFALQGQASYDNVVDATNVVNFAPVRWYTGLQGATLSDLRSEVKGTTNVAQILCHACIDVRIERPRASFGSGAGVAIVNGTRVTVVDAIVESNAGAGILVQGGSQVDLLRTTSVGDGLGILARDTARVTIDGGTVDDPTGDGVHLQRVPVATVSRLAVRSATTGLFLDDVERATLAELDLSLNRGHGLRTVARVSTDVRDTVASRNGASGIFTEGVPHLNLTAFTAAGNRLDGVHVIGDSRLTIRDANTSLNGANGIELDGPMFANLSRLVASDNREEGVRARDPRLLDVRTTHAWGNGGSGVSVTGVQRALVGASTFERNGKAGILLGARTALGEIGGNELRANELAGIWLDGAGPQASVTGNVIADHAAGIKLTRAPGNVLDGNVLTKRPAQVGIVFDDEASYGNDVRATNTVNGEPVRWYVALGGTSRAPVELRGIVAKEPNVTNVAQVMVYRSSYVTLDDVTATGGAARGIYVLRSSSVEVRGGAASGTQAGVELHGAQGVVVHDVRATGGDAGVLLRNTTEATVSRLVASGSGTAVKLAEGSTRAIVREVDASGVRVESVRDPSFVVGPPPRSDQTIVDAGLDKVAGLGQPVTFRDALGLVRGDRVVRQSWEYGDGSRDVGGGESLLRPTYAYSALGERVARYTVETASGATYSDTVRVSVVGRAPRPDSLLATLDGSTLVLTWSTPASPIPILGYRVYHGTSAETLAFAHEETEGATTHKDAAPTAATTWYAISAVTQIGEGELSQPIAIAPIGAPPAEPPPPAEPTAPAAVTTRPPEPPPAGPILPQPKIPFPAGAVLVALGLAALAGARRRP